MKQSERFQLRLSRTDRKLLSTMARSEHRTMSNFIVHLIHERQAQANRLQLDEIVPRDPLPRVRKAPEQIPGQPAQPAQRDAVKPEGSRVEM